MITNKNIVADYHFQIVFIFATPFIFNLQKRVRVCKTNHTIVGSCLICHAIFMLEQIQGGTEPQSLILKLLSSAFVG